ncbi:MAG: LPS export ABC transporter periplasmic protein LptC [Desulfovibrionaceae bacterium]
MRVRVILLLAVIFGFGLFIGMIVFSRQTTLVASPEVRVKLDPAAEYIQSIQKTRREPDVTAEDVELTQGANGRIDWKVKAKSAQYDEDKGLVSVTLPQLTAYVGEDRAEVFLRADRGEVDRVGDNLRLWDDVIGRYGSFALSAEDFDYIGSMDKVYLRGQVSIERQDMAVNATAIEIDVKSRELVAAGGVTATLSPRGLDEIIKQ